MNNQATKPRVTNLSEYKRSKEEMIRNTSTESITSIEHEDIYNQLVKMMNAINDIGDNIKYNGNDKPVENNVNNSSETHIIDNKDSESEYYKKMRMMKNLFYVQLKFLSVAFITIILSLVGMFIFSCTGHYFIHPYLYIMLFVAGMGWGATAISSIVRCRKEDI